MKTWFAQPSEKSDPNERPPNSATCFPISWRITPLTIGCSAAARQWEDAVRNILPSQSLLWKIKASSRTRIYNQYSVCRKNPEHGRRQPAHSMKLLSTLAKPPAYLAAARSAEIRVGSARCSIQIDHQQQAHVFSGLDPIRHLPYLKV